MDVEGAAGGGRKRSRSLGEAPARGRLYGPALPPSMINRFIVAQANRHFPYKDYGRVVVRRGTPKNLAKFGATLKTATLEQRQARKGLGYIGRGAYFGKKLGGMAGRALSTALGGTGGAFSGRVGERVGNWLENKAIDALTPHLPSSLQSIARAYRGTGLYTGRVGYGGHGLYAAGDAIHSNNLVVGATASHLNNSMPTMSTTLDETGAVRVCHREYMSDVYAPGVQGSGVATAFQNTAYFLNPALQQTFTFLSQIAQNYDEYEFRRLIFHYRSTTTDIGNSTTGQCGTVILCTNYNAAAPPFTDKQAMLEYAHAHDCKVTEHMTHGVECDPKKVSLSTKLFTRANPVVTGQDLKTYDHGLFQIALANLPAAYNGLPVGELWVEYDVVLRKPKLFVSRGLEIDQDVFTTVQGGGTLSNPLGSVVGNVLRGQQNNIGCEIGLGGNLIGVTFPAQYTGSLEIQVLFFTAGLATTANLSAPLISARTGNVIDIEDLYTGQGGASSPKSFFSTPLGATLTNEFVSYMATFHVFVRQSTGGVNNSITIQVNPGQADTAPGQGMLMIRQYQSYGLTSTAGRLTWLNGAGQVVVP